MADDLRKRVIEAIQMWSLSRDAMPHDLADQVIAIARQCEVCGEEDCDPLCWDDARERYGDCD